jgi:hypothetical protein
MLKKIVLLSLTLITINNVNAKDIIKEAEEYQKEFKQKQEDLKFEYIKTKELLEINKKKKKLLKLSEKIFNYEKCIKKSNTLKEMSLCGVKKQKKEN